MLVDVQAAHRNQIPGDAADGVIWRLADGDQILGVLGHDVLTNVAAVVVLLDLRPDLFHRRAHKGGDLVDGVGDKGVPLLGGFLQQGLRLLQRHRLGGIAVAAEGLEVGRVVAVDDLLQNALVEHVVVDAVRLPGHGQPALPPGAVAGLVDKALAPLVQPDGLVADGGEIPHLVAAVLRPAGLHHQGTEVGGARAGIQAHEQAVAHVGGDALVVHALIVVAAVLLHQLHAAAEAASGDNNTFRLETHVFSVMLGDHAAQRAVLVDDEVSGPGIAEHPAVIFTGEHVIQAEDQAAAAVVHHILDRRDVHVEHLAPGPYVFKGLADLHAVALQPVQRAHGFFQERPHEPGIDGPVGKVHAQQEQLVLRQVDVVGLGAVGLRGKQAAGQSGISAGAVALFDQDYVRALFRRGHRRRQTGAAGAHHQNLGFVNRCVNIQSVVHKSSSFPYDRSVRQHHGLTVALHGAGAAAAALLFLHPRLFIHENGLLGAGDLALAAANAFIEIDFCLHKNSPSERFAILLK